MCHVSKTLRTTTERNRSIRREYERVGSKPGRESSIAVRVGCSRATVLRVLYRLDRESLPDVADGWEYV